MADRRRPVSRFQRLFGRHAVPEPSSRFSLDDLFSWMGQAYPILNTTAGNIKEEQILSSVQAAYKRSGPLAALIMARVQVFSQARFQWTRFEGGEPTRLFGSPALRLLERPWTGGTTSDLLGRMELNNSTSGNAFVRRVSDNRLSLLRPEWTVIMLGSHEDADHPAEAPDVEVAGYGYLPPSGNARYFPANQIAHYAPLPDPDFAFLGMSWIAPALRDAEADDAMVLHKRQFMTNAATPNLALKFDPSVSLERVLKFKEMFESEHQGSWNAYKTLFLALGADPIPIGKDFQEIDFAATQGKGESRMAALAGVPPSWVGFSEGLQGSALNAGNFNSARRRFSDGTMMHLWTNAATSLEVITDPPDAGSSLWFDTRSVAFMREDAKDQAAIQQLQAATIKTLIDAGFEPATAVDAVESDDWSRLSHTGLTSVQLTPPADGSAPINGNKPAALLPAATTGGA